MSKKRKCVSLSKSSKKMKRIIILFFLSLSFFSYNYVYHTSSIIFTNKSGPYYLTIESPKVYLYLTPPVVVQLVCAPLFFSTAFFEKTTDDDDDDDAFFF